MRVIVTSSVAESDRAGPVVDHQAPQVQRRRRRRAAAAHHRSHPSLELGHGVGLVDEVVGTQIEQPDAILFRGLARAHDDRHGAPAPDLGQDVSRAAVPIEIEHDEVGLLPEDGPQGVRHGVGLDHAIAGLLEEAAQGRAEGVVALRHEDRAGGRERTGPERRRGSAPVQTLVQGHPAVQVERCHERPPHHPCALCAGLCDVSRQTRPDLVPPRWVRFPSKSSVVGASAQLNRSYGPMLCCRGADTVPTRCGRGAEAISGRAGGPESGHAAPEARERRSGTRCRVPWRSSAARSGRLRS